MVLRAIQNALSGQIFRIKFRCLDLQWIALYATMNIAALFTLSPSHRPWRDNRSVPEFPLICIEYFHVKTVLLKIFCQTVS